MTCYHQNTDIDICVDVTQDSIAINSSDVTSAEYRLVNYRNGQTLVVKTLGSGVSVSDNTVTVSLTSADTADLNTVYRHQLDVVSRTKIVRLFNEFVSFEGKI